MVTYWRRPPLNSTNRVASERAEEGSALLCVGVCPVYNFHFKTAKFFKIINKKLNNKKVPWTPSLLTDLAEP